MKQKGLTQEALAEALELSQAAVSKWARGKAVPEGDTLYKLSKILGVSMEWFFAGVAAAMYPHGENPHVPVRESYRPRAVRMLRDEVMEIRKRLEVMDKMIKEIEGEP